MPVRYSVCGHSPLWGFMLTSVPHVIPIVEDVNVVILFEETEKRLRTGEKNIRLVRLGSGPLIGWISSVHTAKPDMLTPNIDLGSGAARRLFNLFKWRGWNLRFRRATDIGDALAYDVLVDV